VLPLGAFTPSARTSCASGPAEPGAPQAKVFVDRYIWSEAAPRALRRRFILTQVCGVAACACLTLLILLNHGRTPALLFGVVTLYGAAYYGWRACRHGL
jgi:hypothetical protein